MVFDKFDGTFITKYLSYFPRRPRGIEAREDRGVGSEVWKHGPELARQFPGRLFVECNAVDIRDGESAGGETIVESTLGHVRIVLASGKSFLFGGGDQDSIFEEATSRVVE